MANKAADMVPTRSRDRLTGARRRWDLSVPGYASGADAPLRATAAALERARHARSIVLVEGISDQIAVETLASLQARDLTKEGVVVVPIGGSRSVSRFLARFRPTGVGLRVSGLCDAAEERHFCRELTRAGYAQPDTRNELEREGFFVCDRDLEDELIRAVGPDVIETILAEEGDLASFRTLQKQAAWRDACFVDQLRRFLAAGARRKLRYARLFVLALDLDRQPRPLRGVLSRA
ncbi:TOPRIM nucleotidyl transferase/hydrolase domain-containing protein [Dongia deserti]|uniref:TOPRIM nucleotidyl transferase/hydrolase domain-containing protein n=1 Tax=Dongia deserti TaxID=2268030 RepID=UPI00254746DC|nr:TOPRIM nucleotidyl transferase/hydrolase domain-containing protein [Dongia deserti]